MFATIEEKFLLAAGIIVAIIATSSFFIYHERHIEHVKDLAHDKQETIKVEAKADAGTKANAQEADISSTEAKHAQASVDSFLAAHPINFDSVRSQSNVGGTGVRQASTGSDGVKSTGTGPVVVRSMPRGFSDGALAEVVSSASRLAVIDAQRQRDAEKQQ